MVGHPAVETLATEPASEIEVDLVAEPLLRANVSSRNAGCGWQLGYCLQNVFSWLRLFSNSGIGVKLSVKCLPSSLFIPR